MEDRSQVLIVLRPECPRGRGFRSSTLAPSNCTFLPPEGARDNGHGFFFASRGAGQALVCRKSSVGWVGWCSCIGNLGRGGYIFSSIGMVKSRFDELGRRVTHCRRLFLFIIIAMTLGSLMPHSCASCICGWDPPVRSCREPLEPASLSTSSPIASAPAATRPAPRA